MLLNGEWRATSNIHRPGFVGFYINALYSPFKSWVDRIYNYLEAKKNPETYQVFVNTVQGRLWKRGSDTPDWEKIYGKRERYEFNRCTQNLKKYETPNLA